MRIRNSRRLSEPVRGDRRGEAAGRWGVDNWENESR